LIVDDDPNSAETLATLVRLWGYEARAANDGPSALAEARTFRPEVVLLDLTMPGMDGYDVARRLVLGPDDALLVAVTGHDDEEDRRRAFEAGFDAHIAKPLDLPILERLLADPASARRSAPA